ncbi:acetate permease [Burkholderia pseudomallei]|nr:acetate permease [Burkholderia pseudomallei]CAJ2809677.1 acetate permease [Burkholderia pseudomallei]CAJ3359982.1 acetate permease [Burkholderia pseudomallei]CAJ3362578.1 acetate permease [Burkholderia pseudomallei]CAJ3920982.1 acetate permease [Burkholderia pseudomallei]
MCPTTARDDVGVARLPVRPSRGCRALAPGAQVGREGGGTAAGRASYASHAMAPRVLGGSHGFAVPADRADGDGGRTLANRRPSAILTPPSRRAAEPPNRRTAEPPNRRTAEPPNRRTAEPPNRRTAEPPSRRTAEPQNRRTAEPQWPCNIEKSGAAGSSGGASRGTGAWPGRRAGVDPFDGARRCLRYWRQSKPSHPSNTNARPKPHHPNPRPTRPTGHPR